MKTHRWEDLRETQEEVAEAAKMTQSEISRMERRPPLTSDFWLGLGLGRCI